jgi:hypothetical protein
MQDYLMELIEILKGMGPFWQPPEHWLSKIGSKIVDDETDILLSSKPLFVSWHRIAKRCAY